MRHAGVESMPSMSKRHGRLALSRRRSGARAGLLEAMIKAMDDVSCGSAPKSPAPWWWVLLCGVIPRLAPLLRGSRDAWRPRGKRRLSVWPSLLLTPSARNPSLRRRPNLG
eukprot:7652230-Alexandrium_andersonii.AAC.1